MQGIKFNQDGITAILEGRKTMTRRPIEHDCTIQLDEEYKYSIRDEELTWNEFKTLEEFISFASKYKIGETVFVQSSPDEYFPSEMTKDEARIFLKIINIKVERLQDISEEDCIKEGVIRSNTYSHRLYGERTLFSFYDSIEFESAKDCFIEKIWDELPYQAPYDWDSNPYVFVYEFKRVENV